MCFFYYKKTQGPGAPTKKIVFYTTKLLKNLIKIVKNKKWEKMDVMTMILTKKRSDPSHQIQKRPILRQVMAENV